MLCTRSVGDDLELLDLMQKAGCRQVLIGLKSPTPEQLSGLEKNADRKAHWAPHYAESIHRIQEHGITVNACFILSLDGQDPAVFEKCPLFDVNYQPTGMSPQQLREGIYWLAEHLYADEPTRHRRKGFLSHWHHD